MAAIDTASPSRKATVTRVVITLLSIVPISFVGVGYAAAGPVGIPMGVPALYLLWVLAADSFALFRGVRRSDVYHARPRYKWFLTAGLLVVAIWIGLLVAHGATFGHA